MEDFQSQQDGLEAKCMASLDQLEALLAPHLS